MCSYLSFSRSLVLSLAAVREDMEVGKRELCDLPSSHRGCRSRTHGAYNGRLLELPLDLNKWLFCRFHSMATEKRVCHEGMINKAVSQKTLMTMFSLHVSIVLFSFNYDYYPKSPRMLDGMQRNCF